MRRLLLLGGVVGPASFVGAWLVAGLVRDGYDPVQQTISQLAGQDVPTRPLMTVGLLGFGLLLPLFALALQPRGLQVAATTSGLATLAVAATPLSPTGGTTVDLLHYLAAGIGYCAQTAAPLAGARALARPALSRAVGVLCGVLLVASLLDASRAGLWQRAGLGVVDVWFVVLAVRLLQTGRRA